MKKDPLNPGSTFITTIRGYMTQRGRTAGLLGITSKDAGKGVASQKNHQKLDNPVRPKLKEDHHVEDCNLGLLENSQTLMVKKKEHKGTHIPLKLGTFTRNIKQMGLCPSGRISAMHRTGQIISKNIVNHERSRPPAFPGTTEE